ncbi:MAG: cytochrome c maturation protein CcmE [Gammaproteobacteria bacterium]|nr:cytochrome c maturation protein CcmE [Gammaproteobacteria bacterium]
MNPVRKKRLIIVLAILAGMAATVGLAVFALSENINLFYTPSEIVEGKAPQDVRIRAGGLVRDGSVQRDEDALTVQFDVTDGEADITIEYKGILPDLFREGQGIVALGRLNEQGVLVADEVLAKHDENYMPPEVSSALEKTGMLKHYEETQESKK